MIIQGIDKFEYCYIVLKSSIQYTLKDLNKLGQEGWEIVQLEKPKSTGDTYKALFKRKISEVEI